MRPDSGSEWFQRKQLLDPNRKHPPFPVEVKYSNIDLNSPEIVTNEIDEFENKFDLSELEMREKFYKLYPVGDMNVEPVQPNKSIIPLKNPIGIPHSMTKSQSAYSLKRTSKPFVYTKIPSKASVDLRLTPKQLRKQNDSIDNNSIS